MDNGNNSWGYLNKTTMAKKAKKKKSKIKKDELIDEIVHDAILGGDYDIFYTLLKSIPKAKLLKAI